MKALIYGPPGVGKSTLIRVLQDAGYPAFDMETVPESDRTPNRVLSRPETIIAMADLPVRRCHDCVLILLTMAQKHYEKRKLIRKQLKADTQPAHDVSIWRELIDWDGILFMQDGEDPMMSALHLIRIVQIAARARQAL